MKIGELARSTGATVKTIRFYGNQLGVTVRTNCS